MLRASNAHTETVIFRVCWNTTHCVQTVCCTWQDAKRRCVLLIYSTAHYTNRNIAKGSLVTASWQCAVRTLSCALPLTVLRVMLRTAQELRLLLVYDAVWLGITVAEEYTSRPRKLHVVANRKEAGYILAAFSFVTHSNNTALLTGCLVHNTCTTRDSVNELQDKANWISCQSAVNWPTGVQCWQQYRTSESTAVHCALWSPRKREIVATTIQNNSKKKRAWSFVSAAAQSSTEHHLTRGRTLLSWGPFAPSKGSGEADQPFTLWHNDSSNQSRKVETKALKWVTMKGRILDIEVHKYRNPTVFGSLSMLCHHDTRLPSVRCHLPIQFKCYLVFWCHRKPRPFFFPWKTSCLITSQLL